MPTERLTFEGRDGVRLTARLDLPEGPHLATALFAHCFSCGPDVPAARRIARRLTALGIAVCRFDMTGLGHAGGEIENPTFSANAADLMTAAQELTARGMPPSLLIGHSLGGAAILCMAPWLDCAKAVVTLATPFDPTHANVNYGGALERPSDRGWVRIDLGTRSFRVDDRFIADIAPGKIAQDLGKLNKALLVMHAPRDAVVGIENATRIFSAAKHPKSFVTLDTADHLISDPADADDAAGVIAAWAARHLDLRPPAPPPGAPEGVTRVIEVDPRGLQQDVALGPRHYLTADEPLAYGGTDRGPSPYQLLAAGLGACTAMTIRLYARRKGWPLAQVMVEVTHDKVHAQDGAHCTDGDKIDRFTRRITLEGKLDTPQRVRLIEIADRCPVHRTLSGASRIDTTLVG
jgi:putative redox protein